MAVSAALLVDVVVCGLDQEGAIGALELPGNGEQIYTTRYTRTYNEIYCNVWEEERAVKIFTSLFLYLVSHKI